MMSHPPKRIVCRTGIPLLCLSHHTSPVTASLASRLTRDISRNRGLCAETESNSESIDDGSWKCFHCNHSFKQLLLLQQVRNRWGTKSDNTQRHPRQSVPYSSSVNVHPLQWTWTFQLHSMKGAPGRSPSTKSFGCALGHSPWSGRLPSKYTTKSKARLGAKIHVGGRWATLFFCLAR